MCLSLTFFDNSFIVHSTCPQYGKRVGQPVPAGRGPEPRGRRDRLPDQGREADHAHAGRPARARARREAGEGARGYRYRNYLLYLVLAATDSQAFSEKNSLYMGFPNVSFQKKKYKKRQIVSTK